VRPGSSRAELRFAARAGSRSPGTLTWNRSWQCHLRGYAGSTFYQCDTTNRARATPRARAAKTRAVHRRFPPQVPVTTHPPGWPDGLLGGAVEGWLRRRGQHRCSEVSRHRVPGIPQTPCTHRFANRTVSTHARVPVTVLGVVPAQESPFMHDTIGIRPPQTDRPPAGRLDLLPQLLDLRAVRAYIHRSAAGRAAAPACLTLAVKLIPARSRSTDTTLASGALNRRNLSAPDPHAKPIRTFAPSPQPPHQRTHPPRPDNAVRTLRRPTRPLRRLRLESQPRTPPRHLTLAHGPNTPRPCRTPSACP